jgi:hypothetical protein
MDISPDSIRLYEQGVLQQAEVLGLGLTGLRVADPERAVELLARIIERLHEIVRREGPAVPMGDTKAAHDRRQPFLVSSKASESEDIEEFLLDLLAASPKGLSVQNLMDDFEEAQLAIKRQTLVVRLHRMVRAGKLVSLAHGHYAMSDAEQARRHS